MYVYPNEDPLKIDSNQYHQPRKYAKKQHIDNICVCKCKIITCVYTWLVVSTPLKNISQLGSLFPIYGKVKNVPNHQPVYIYTIYMCI